MRRFGAVGERAAALLMTAILLFNPPLLSIFSSEQSVFGLPLSYLYLFGAWGLVIVLIALHAERSRFPFDDEPRRDAGGETPRTPRARPGSLTVLGGWMVLLVSVGYLGLLFAIAYYGDKRAEAGRSLINNPYIYALSIGVYATSWTFYGSVGRAASSGLDFLTIYLGPTLVFVAWWFVLAKIIQISKANRITSIADFIASRYGKSALLGGMITVIAVFGIIPYISLQLKAVSTSLTVLLQYPEIVMPRELSGAASMPATALMVATAMAFFAILFGTRHIDPSEHHEGMVAAIAFESIVKLVAFVAIGIFVTFGVYNGFGDLFSRAAQSPALSKLISVGHAGNYGQWVTLTLLSMAAIICLPRQFHMMVVENVSITHLKKAAWLFPLYLLLINIFVLPIPWAGC